MVDYNGGAKKWTPCFLCRSLLLSTTVLNDRMAKASIIMGCKA